MMISINTQTNHVSNLSPFQEDKTALNISRENIIFHALKQTKTSFLFEAGPYHLLRLIIGVESRVSPNNFVILTQFSVQTQYN